MAWIILVEDHQRNISTKLYRNRSSGFWQEDFYSFLYRYIVKIIPTPGGHVFWRIQMARTILVEDHQSNISAKLYGNQSSGFWQEDFLKFSILIYRENKPRPPWQLCFLTNPNGLNNLGRGSPKEHFYQIISQSVQWFLTRRFFKFSIKIYRENKPRPLAAMFFDKSKWLEKSW